MVNRLHVLNNIGKVSGGNAIQHFPLSNKTKAQKTMVIIKEVRRIMKLLPPMVEYLVGVEAGGFF